MRTCYYEGCSEWIGVEWFFCPDHRHTEYAHEFRLQNGYRQP